MGDSANQPSLNEGFLRALEENLIDNLYHLGSGARRRFLRTVDRALLSEDIDTGLNEVLSELDAKETTHDQLDPDFFSTHDFVSKSVFQRGTPAESDLLWAEITKLNVFRSSSEAMSIYYFIVNHTQEMTERERVGFWNHILQTASSEFGQFLQQLIRREVDSHERSKALKRNLVMFLESSQRIVNS